MFFGRIEYTSIFFWNFLTFIDTHECKLRSSSVANVIRSESCNIAAQTMYLEHITLINKIVRTRTHGHLHCTPTASRMLGLVGGIPLCLEGQNSGMLSLGTDQLILSQPGGKYICQPHYYWHPWISKPSYNPPFIESRSQTSSGVEAATMPRKQCT